MLRVDVPETSKQPAFTRFYGSAAIYSIIPADEEIVKAMAERYETQPIESWNLSEIIKKHATLGIGAASERGYPEEEDDDLPY